MAKAKKSSSGKSRSAVSVPIHPLGDKVVVRPLTEEEKGTKTASGIIIPDTAKKESKEGTVVAVGPGKLEEGMRVPPSVKVGDRVLYREGYDNDVEWGGEKYFIVSEESILAILN